MKRVLKRKDFARWQAGKVFLGLSGDALAKALQSGVLLEIHCEQNH
jgi:hypothetical protein